MTADGASAARQFRGVHHVRLPVRDLATSFAFYHDVLGYERDFDFPGSDGPAGWALKHANGAPSIVLWHDADRAVSDSGFPWFSIAMPSERAVRELAAELERRAIPSGGIQPAFVGVKLPHVQDPDGHLIGFYVAGPRPPAPSAT